MRIAKSSALVTMFLSIFMMPCGLLAYDIPFGESTYMEFKGDLTYTAKVRTEDPDPDLAKEAMGDSNFEKGDMMNNKGIARLEIKFDSTYLTLFGKGEAFYDRVMDDDSKYPEGTDIDEAKKYAARRYEAQEYYLDFHTNKFSLRAGRQIVEWGESVAPVYAPGVGVLNLIDSSRLGAAGYTFRDAKVPGLMAWSSLEIVSGLSIEGVYAPDFDPRYAVPVVGTSFSFMDIGGFGSPKNMKVGTLTVPYDDQRPTEFKDMQQYGGAIRNVFESLGNLEVGLYYFHYYDWSPMVTVTPIPLSAKAEYGETDMYGISFSQAIDSFGLDLQINGELAYRPNEPAQLGHIVTPAEATLMQGFGVDIEAGDISAGDGFTETRTLNWGLGGSRIFSDFLSFTPWIVQFSPMFECYGGNNLDYHNTEKLDGKVFFEPEHIAYYMVGLNFTTADMIDNTTLTLAVSGMGCLHKEQRSIHTITSSLTAKIGDTLGIMVGYDYKRGDPEEASNTPWEPDRDAVSGSLTLYFM